MKVPLNSFEDIRSLPTNEKRMAHLGQTLIKILSLLHFFKNQADIVFYHNLSNHLCAKPNFLQNETMLVVVYLSFYMKAT